MRLEERMTTLSRPDGAVAQAVTLAGRVLVVDDEPSVRLVFRTSLESAGFEVDEAVEGTAALERIRVCRPDVVLLDLKMPVRGGMEVLQELRDAGDDIPVVIVTAHGTIPDAVSAMKLGAIDFLSKPLTPERLRQVVSEVIERHRPQAVEQKEGSTSAWPATVTMGPPLVDLAPAKLALNRRNFDLAEAVLGRALDAAPHSAEALTLMGVLLESRGQDHAAYHSYKEALQSDRTYKPARENMQRYCERTGLDACNPVINPAAGA
jgi:DNA-binding response OmpR family regulator